jgi:hypothetical protein
LTGRQGAVDLTLSDRMARRMKFRPWRSDRENARFQASSGNRTVRRADPNSRREHPLRDEEDEDARHA